MTGSNTVRRANATADHHSSSAIVAGLSGQVTPSARHRRPTTNAQQQAAAIAASLAGPAATAPCSRWTASAVHGVGWSMAGQLGWLVIAAKVARKLAAAAAPSATAPGVAALAR